MRKVTLLIGSILLLAGIVSEAMYITTSNVAYGSAVSANSYLVLGILSILLGLIVMFVSVRVPKVRVS